MRVGTFFRVCMAAAAIGGVGYAGQRVADALSAWRNASAARLELQAFRDVFRVPEMVLAERVASVGALSAAAAATTEERASLATVRGATDSAFATVAQSLTSAAGGGTRLAEMKDAKGLLAGMRAEVDRLSAVPLADRKANVSDVMKPAQLAYEAFSRVLTAIQIEPTLSDPAIQDDLDLSRMAYSLRLWAGQRGTALIAAIVSGAPMPPAVIENLANAVGHIEEIWGQILTYQATRQLAPEVVQGIAAVKARYFGDNSTLYAQVLQAGRSDAAYPKVADFRRDHAAGAASPYLIRDGALAHAVRRAEAIRDGAARALTISLLMLVGVCAVVGGASRLFSRRVVGGLTALTGAITALAGRDHAIAVPLQHRRDEIGLMARAVEQLRQDAIAFAALSARAEAEQTTRLAGAARVGALCEAFHAETQTTIKAAIASTAAMREGVQANSSLVEEVGQRTVNVVAATGQASQSVTAIVSSTEHLSRSIDGLSEQVGVSTRIASEAEQAVGQAEQRMQELTSATQRIGEVTSLIEQIASQTNLLALNATIEAARAGEAGKGFAVVAGEVKALATQTAKATADIAGQIGLLQNATGGVEGTIARISATIAEIARVGQTVSEAVEQQKKATADIGGHVAETASGIRLVATDIETVRGVTDRTGSASRSMGQAASRLTADAEQLTAQIAAFIGQVRQTSHA